MKYYNFIIFILILTSCRFNEKKYFDGELFIISDSPAIQKAVISDSLNEKLEIFGNTYIYDTLLIQQISNNENFWFSIHNIVTGEEIGYFCHKGKGVNEVLYTTGISNFYVANNELKTIVIDGHNDKMYEWNITLSIKAKSTIFDKVTDYKPKDPLRPYSYTYTMDNGDMIGYLATGANDTNVTKPELHQLELVNVYSGEMKKQINIFKDMFEEEDIPHNNMSDPSYIPSMLFYRGPMAAKPGGEFVAQAMRYIAQVNIVDIKTGKVKGYRIDDTPNFKIFKNYKKITKNYFIGDIVATDKYIYVGYSGDDIKDKKAVINYIYKFDWEGQILNKYKIDIPIGKMAYNALTGDIYVQDNANSKFYLLALP